LVAVAEWFSMIPSRQVLSRNRSSENFQTWRCLECSGEYLVMPRVQRLAKQLPPTPSANWRIESEPIDESQLNWTDTPRREEKWQVLKQNKDYTAKQQIRWQSRKGNWW
jgi:hypothetical protein